MTSFDRWRASEHAIDRWVQRVEPGASREQARAAILRLAATLPSGGRTLKNDPILVGEGPSGPVGLIIRYGRPPGAGRRGKRWGEPQRTVATVLSPAELDPSSEAAVDAIAGLPDAPEPAPLRPPRVRPYRRAALAALRAIALGQGDAAVVAAMLREAPDLLDAFRSEEP